MMIKQSNNFPTNKLTSYLLFNSILLKVTFTILFCIIAVTNNFTQGIYQPNTFTQFPQVNNYLANSTTFKQEIARLEINVTRRAGKTLPITQVPRLEKDDILKVKLSDDAINGIKPDQSNWDWSFLIAYINPGRKNDANQYVSEEIQFRKTGWYKEYVFTVPYDSQPIFFIYPKTKYRDKILKLINHNQEEIRKIGEKTIELSDAYAQIGSFLSQLQMVIYSSQYYSSFGGYGYYNNYGYNNGINTNNTLNYSMNRNIFLNQLVEGLARSFNVQLPNCWGGGNIYGGNGYYSGGYNNGYNGYNGNYNNNYNYGYNGFYGTNSMSSYGVNSYGISNDFLNRVQCIAKNVRLEDFDLSVSKLLQQGGILAAAQLSQKYPQLAFWINIAAAAIDIILKVSKKAPLKIVPTVISTGENASSFLNAQPPNLQQGQNFQQNYPFQQNQSLAFQQNLMNQSTLGNNLTGSKISLYAEAPPNNSDFITAYPLVINKWQANPDPETISLPTPILLDSCLHVGQNILQSSDLLNDWMKDNYIKDFKVSITSENGFQKSFPLKKNIGLNGWELNLTKEDLSSFPKVNLTLESEIVGKRGFNEVRSPKFSLPIPSNSSWEITDESRKQFSVGGKRFISLRNQFGKCNCLQTIIYRPNFGGEFVFETGSKKNPLLFSSDEKEVSFEIDTDKFIPGDGQIELRQTGSEPLTLPIKLYPQAPEITDFRISKGDNTAVITGYGLNQVNSITLNGKRAVSVDEKIITDKTLNSTPSFPMSNKIEQKRNEVAQSTSKEIVNSPNIGTTSNGSIIAENPNLRDETKKENINPGINQINPETQPISQNFPQNFPMQSNVGKLSDTVTKVNDPIKPSPKMLAEKTFKVEEALIFQENKTISIEFELEDNRIYLYPKTYTLSPARPAIIVNENNEIDGVSTGSQLKSLLDLTNSPIFPIDSHQISVSVQNALTDYDFKAENIHIETRIENSQIDDSFLPKASFEVLDWKNMLINFQIDEQSQKFLTGKRIQFRITDRNRGSSNWISVRDRFARLPESALVKCPINKGDNCILKGKGVEYISQVSVDGGKTWFPQLPSTLVVKPDINGEKTASIPPLSNSKFILIRLRDYYIQEGIKLPLSSGKQVSQSSNKISWK